MKCPACGNQLTAVTYDGLTLDGCQGTGCGGLFFDQFELKKLDEPSELTGEKFAEFQKQEAKKTVGDEKRACPKCAGIKMMRHFFSVKRETLIDECPGCGGVWLDAGDLDKIRHEFTSAAERDTAAQAYFDKMFDPALAQILAEEHKHASVGTLGRIFSFFSRSKKS